MKKIIILINFFCLLHLSAQKDHTFFEPIAEELGYRLIDSTEQNTLICFGGWSTQKAWVENWAWELQNARPSLKLRAVYAVKGPEDVFYKNNEIPLDSLYKHLIESEINTKIFVLAHSSGSFVAHKFFHTLMEKNALFLLNKIDYYNLDGAMGSETPKTTITSKIAEQLNAVYAVYATEEMSNLLSPNAEEMKKMVLLFPEKAASIELRSDNSGCLDTWCVHELLINAFPHNKNGFDLEKDYLHIDEEHPVTTQFLRD
ncbi:MAG: hypothetical protein WBN50_10405 [Lutimonas sp.]